MTKPDSERAFQTMLEGTRCWTFRGIQPPLKSKSQCELRDLKEELAMKYVETKTKSNFQNFECSLDTKSKL